ncbi:hypothetical protein Scani_18280 [Streptomyces caniferus]|uniref:Uncharacterized protein n=1 Tax=Streptomyces caniferus TaxID=285557 RepID=A0A640S323_9ACTN|nr:hypothetical protein Scani_18280 [Streptomyces caniferus]
MGADVPGLDFQDVPLPGQGFLPDRGVKPVQRAVYGHSSARGAGVVQDVEVLRPEYLGEQQHLHAGVFLGEQPAARPVQTGQDVDPVVEPDPVADLDDVHRPLHCSAPRRRPAGLAVTRVSSFKGRAQSMDSRPCHNWW